MAKVNKKKVVVAMSGGVDSSVTAALLKEQGFEVIGLGMHVGNYSREGEEPSQRCCGSQDVIDARRVASLLDIPYYLLNLRIPFQEEVIDYFVQEYLQGRTPNPCILCNEKVKFAALLRKAREIGASFLATGHYARLSKDREGLFVLRKGTDQQKDQSYFLFSLDQDQLSFTLFPLGSFTKDEIRKKAKKLNLPVAEKKESQEICFITQRRYSEFIQQRLPGKNEGEGEIVDKEGNCLGHHAGIHHFTIGQRKGLGISFSSPRYVIRLEPGKNQVVVGTKKDLLSRECVVEQVHWIRPDSFRQNLEVGTRIRYRHREISSRLRSRGDKSVAIEFNSPQPAVAPGQAAVFYKGDEVLGGGWIREAIPL